jgi:hypothetical protein
VWADSGRTRLQPLPSVCIVALTRVARARAPRATQVGTRYFEVMATGTTLCVCNRLSDGRVYESLGLRDGVHLAMFDSLAHLEEIVLNYSRSEHEARRLAIVHRAQALVLRKFTWTHVAERVGTTLRGAVRSFVRIEPVASV